MPICCAPFRIAPGPIKAGLKALAKDSHGAAMIEFGLVLTMLSFGLVNGVEFARYSFQQMELENATQAGAQAVWNTCNTTAKLPAAYNCGTGLSDAVTHAIQATSLGSGVTLSTALTSSEGYYCVQSNGSLALAVAITSGSTAKPSNCSNSAVGSGTGSGSDTPGDYMVISTSYTYSPIFTSTFLNKAMGLPTAMTSTAYVRLQ